MHPISTALMLVGYFLAVPIITRIFIVVKQQQRIVLAAHQLGIILATAGWILKGNYPIAAIHIIWMVLLKIWFWYRGKFLSDSSSVMT